MIYNLLTLVLVCFIFSCSGYHRLNSHLESVQRTFFVMGTSLEFHLVCESRDKCLQVINESMTEVNRIDMVFSNYKADSELGMLNIREGKKLSVSEEFLYLTQYSKDISVLTNGAFDITVGPLIGLWKEQSKNSKLPDSGPINSIKEKCVGFDKLEIYPDSSSIQSSSDCLELDYGAIGKGYVLKRIGDILRINDINNALINFGGNIYALGNDVTASPWTVKIKDPDKDGEYFADIEISDLSVSTSGGYERYFTVDGKKYSHIIDPRTGYPVNHFTSVTVVSKDPVLADALSTAFAVLEVNESKAILDKLQEPSALLISRNKEGIKIYHSNNFEQLTKKTKK